MTEEVNQEVELHEDDINEIVEEETLEENETISEAEKLLDKGKDEDEAEKSVDDAEDAVKKQAPAPKTKAGMISAMTDKMLKMSKTDMESMYNSYHKDMKKEEVEEMEGEAIVESPEVDTMGELNALVESEATLSDEFKEKTAVIFEAAVKSKLSEEIDRLESQYKEELEEELSSTKSENISKYSSKKPSFIFPLESK